MCGWSILIFLIFKIIQRVRIISFVWKKTGRESSAERLLTFFFFLNWTTYIWITNHCWYQFTSVFLTHGNFVLCYFKSLLTGKTPIPFAIVSTARKTSEKHDANGSKIYASFADRVRALSCWSNVRSDHCRKCFECASPCLKSYYIGAKSLGFYVANQSIYSNDLLDNTWCTFTTTSLSSIIQRIDQQLIVL